VILTIPVLWGGPYQPGDVIRDLADGGVHPTYAGEDYGLYQIYGRHILAGPDALLYLGRATQQTFADRFRQHAAWLAQEEEVRVYVGRVYAPERHTSADEWASWVNDVCLAECVMIYKYSPHYNSVSVAEPPPLRGLHQVIVTHGGPRNRLHARDVAPDDWHV
jgi:hypothetical protein